VTAERAVSRALGGSCAVPLGAYAELSGGRLRLRALVSSLDGRRIARADCGSPEAAIAELERHGARDILSGLGK
jgi:hydroxymethylbilane synthase